jgi:hypothetical protein
MLRKPNLSLNLATADFTNQRVVASEGAGHDQTEPFLKAIAANDTVAIAYIVTDEERLFESVAQALPERVEPVRLYEAYLRNFEIESGRGSL